MKKKIALSLIFLLLIITATGCNKNSNLVANTINTLTSDKYAGRAIGSEGNKLTETYIVDKLTSLKIDTYKESYLHSFEGSSYIPKDQSVTMKIVLNNGKDVKELTYGDDFLVNSATNLNAEYSLSSSITNEKNKISLLKSISEILNPNIGNIAIVKQDALSNGVLTEEKNKIVIFVNEEVYSLCENNLDAKIKVDFSFKKSTIAMNNIIGKIPGKDSSNAIVISSHLDHVGSIGNNIWRGALDNASGVASTLYIAQYLKENFEAPQYDIVFIFFNGEETSLLGSNYLVPKLKKDYDKILNINIDCIGTKAIDTLLIGSSNEEFRTTTVDFFNSQTLNSKAISNAIGDGGAFESNGIPSISLIDNEFENKIHILDDTSKNISFNRIEEISKICSNLIIDQGDKLLEKFSLKTSSSLKEKSEVISSFSISEDEFKQWEYKYVQNGKVLIPVGKNSLNLDISNFETEKKHLSEDLLNIFSLKFQLKPYTLSNKLQFKAPKASKDHEAEKIYTFTPSENNFLALDSNLFNSNTEELPRYFRANLSRYLKSINSDVNLYNKYLNNVLTLDYEKRSDKFEPITVNGINGQILYNSKTPNQPTGLVLFIEKDNGFYTIHIKDDAFTSSFFDSKEDLLKLITSTGILEWYGEIINNFEK
ncbi:Zn-dependent M28 family amino/carboxypeptidase [Clostridium punense]|uniref:Zn-dependent M28 family amino/carboxypeptidase n=1 Tax=Clostridium punense TaxID=1054297 RepID=A0ABS4K5Q9_9CLOT|nr:M28 family metallopeptidase [Clostridium punense]MBP2023109.1 Zn-dependent M28 family amino/carboxypeptidase [Clostridium punense]